MNKYFCTFSFFFFSFFAFSQTKVAEISIPDGDIDGEPVFVNDTLNGNAIYMYYQNETKLIVAKGNVDFKFSNSLKAIFPLDKLAVAYDILTDVSFDFADQKAYFLLKSTPENSFCLIKFDFISNEASYELYEFNIKPNSSILIGAKLTGINFKALYINNEGNNFSLFQTKGNGQYQVNQFQCTNDFFNEIIKRPFLGAAYIANRQDNVYEQAEGESLIAPVKVYFKNNYVQITKDFQNTQMLKVDFNTYQQTVKNYFNKNLTCNTGKKGFTASCICDDKLFQLTGCPDLITINVYDLESSRLYSAISCRVTDPKTSFFNYTTNLNNNKTLTRVTVPFFENITNSSEIISKIRMLYPYIYAIENERKYFILTMGSFSPRNSQVGPYWGWSGGKSKKNIIVFTKLSPNE
ncbi:MAG: hypothetical protein ACM3H8_11475 [Sphingobacteriales bacterium]